MIVDVDRTKLVIEISSVLIATCAFVFTVLQWRLNQRKDKFDRTFRMLETWNAADLRASKDYLWSSFIPGLDEGTAAKGYKDLSAEDLGHLRKVTYFLEYVGAAAKFGYLDKELLLYVIGDSITNLWRELGHSVKAQRAIRGRMQDVHGPFANDYANEFLCDFESLAEESRVFTHRRKKHRRYQGTLADLRKEMRVQHETARRRAGQ